MITPTWSDLSRLLNSDDDSEEWAAEARQMIEHDEEDRLLVWELVDQASDDVHSALMTIEEDSTRPEITMTEADELKRLAYAAKRGAVKLLIAAFSAEMALEKLRRAEEGAAQ